MKRVRFPLLLSFLAILLSTCQQAPPRPFLEEQLPEGQPRLTWPRPPAVARVTYLAEISSEKAFAAPRPWLRRLARALWGRPEERFVRPAALCVREPLLAVADPGRAAVHLLDLVERRWTTVTRTPDGMLASPVGVACLPDGHVIVSDSVRQALWIYDDNGTPKGRFTESELQRPTGLALDLTKRRLWVTETLAHRVLAFDLTGRALDHVGSRGSAPGQFNYPTMIASDRNGGLWVTDSLNARLQHVDAPGRVDRLFGTAGDRAGAFARPRGLAVDTAGRIFAVDALFDAVQIFDDKGNLLLVFGERGVGPGQFWLPSDVAMDERNRIYVADSYNQRIQIFAYHAPNPD